ncbi:MAG: cytochrome c family protein [Alphaproteobacteria bacterium]|nr:cytochrome c family protein [Alphaproteobacteria bacterium]
MRAATFTLALLIASAPAGATDADKGKVQFGIAGQDCITCHPQENNTAAIGPSLCGVMGRKAAGHMRYPTYSAALKVSGITWTRDRLDKFLTSPLANVRGTRMGFAGIADKTERENVIAYLERETGGELCLWDRLTPP